MKKTIQTKINNINDILKNSGLSENEIIKINESIGFIIGTFKGTEEVILNILNADIKDISNEKKFEILASIVK